MVELNEKAVEVGQRVEKYTGEARWFGTILSTYTTGRGKVRHVVEVEPQGFQMIAVPEQLRPAPALPAPDDGLVGRLEQAGADYRDRLPATSSLFFQAATALQSKAEQIERLTRERDEALADPYKVMGGIYEKWKARAEVAEQQVQKLTADKSSALGLLNHLIDWIVHDCGAEVPFTDEQDAAFIALETQEGGK